MWLLVDAKAGSNIKHEIIHSDHGRATMNLTLSSPKSIRDRDFASYKTSSSRSINRFTTQRHLLYCKSIFMI